MPLKIISPQQCMDVLLEVGYHSPLLLWDNVLLTTRLMGTYPLGHISTGSYPHKAIIIIKLPQGSYNIPKDTNCLKMYRVYANKRVVM